MCINVSARPDTLHCGLGWSTFQALENVPLPPRTALMSKGGRAGRGSCGTAQKMFYVYFRTVSIAFLYETLYFQLVE